MRKFIPDGLRGDFLHQLFHLLPKYVRRKLRRAVVYTYHMETRGNVGGVDCCVNIRSECSRVFAEAEVIGLREEFVQRRIFQHLRTENVSLARLLLQRSDTCLIEMVQALHLQNLIINIQERRALKPDFNGCTSYSADITTVVAGIGSPTSFICSSINVFWEIYPPVLIMSISTARNVNIRTMSNLRRFFWATGSAAMASPSAPAFLSNSSLERFGGALWMPMKQVFLVTEDMLDYGWVR
jgi:hypothetical protein